MDIYEHVLEEIFSNHKNEEEINIFNFPSMNVNKVYLSNLYFERIEYLCLKNNHIRDISFITSFPNLWYLDIRENFVQNILLKLDRKLQNFGE